MKKSDLLEIGVKLLGLYLFFLLVTSLPGVFTAITFWLDPSFEYWTEDASLAAYLLLNFLNVVAWVYLSYLFVFRTQRVLKIIAKDEELENEVAVGMDGNNLFEVAIKILGLYILLTTLPEFFYTVKDQIQITQFNLYQLNEPKPNTRRLFILIFEVVLSVAVIVYASNISRLLSLKNIKE